VKVKRPVCHTKLVTGPVKLTAKSAPRATLSRAGVVYATGYSHSTPLGPEIRLLATRMVARGHYRLVVTRREGRRLIITRHQVTIG
jgi:hypothetical protein